MEAVQCGACGCDPEFSQDKLSLRFFLEFPMIPTHRSEDAAWAAEKDHQSLQIGRQRSVQTLDLVIPFLVIFSKELKKKKKTQKYQQPLGTEMHSTMLSVIVNVEKQCDRPAPGLSLTVIVRGPHVQGAHLIWG